MTPKELMLAAIRREPLPALAVTTYNFHPYGGWIAYEQVPEYAPMLEAVTAAPNVGMLCKKGPARRSALEELITVEETTDESGSERVTRWATPKGELKTVYRQPPGQPGYVTEHLLKTAEDIEKYRSVPLVADEVDMSPVKEFYEVLGDDGMVYPSYRDPMYTLASKFDYGEFTIACMQDLPLIKTLVDREFERIKIELEQMLAQSQGYDFLFYVAGPEVATPPMLPPSVFRELVTPYHKELVGMIHDAGHLVAIHCHGRVREVMDDFLEIGSDMLEPMEPPPEGDITLEEALEYVDGRICLTGYIQDQDLHTAKPGEMRAKVEAIREIVGGRSGYMMTNTATPFLDQPPPQFVRNYVEFIEAASEPLVY